MTDNTHPDKIHPGIARMKYLFDKVQIGCLYQIDTGLRWNNTIVSSRLMYLIDKRKYNDYSYSLFLKGYRSGTAGVIYLWLVPSWNSNFQEHIVNIKEFADGYK